MQPLSGRYCRNYLRARREYSEPNRVAVAAWELPPRARRIHLDKAITRLEAGTTSACAENTPRGSHFTMGHRNYLRVRGEYPAGHRERAYRCELPPHARRIPLGDEHITAPTGTTSACAENTGERRFVDERAGNYLRMRGEYGIHYDSFSVWLELPPHARRIHDIDPGITKINGTTSACAENTQTIPNPAQNIRNYLRVRGEYAHLLLVACVNLELPPRARRIPPNNHHERLPNGTTSACAENTRFEETLDRFDGNYLRVRGEYAFEAVITPRHSELPPRARRIPVESGMAVSFLGTTSACAENTTT